MMAKSKKALGVKEKKQARVATVLKKASELETLCGADVALLITHPVSGRVFTFPDDRSQFARTIQRFRSCGPKKRTCRAVDDKGKKKMELSHDHQIISVSGPGSSSSSSSSSRDTFDMEVISGKRDGFDFEDPELWYCDNSDGIEFEDPAELWLCDNGDGFELVDPDCVGGVDHQPGLGVMGFGAPHRDEMADLLALLEMNQQKGIEIEGEDRSQVIEMEYNPDFNLEELWNGIP